MVSNLLQQILIYILQPQILLLQHSLIIPFQFIKKLMLQYLQKIYFKQVLNLNLIKADSGLILQLLRLLPYLKDIINFLKVNQNQGNSKISKINNINQYFLQKQQRSQLQSQLAHKYIRFAIQLIHQWNIYMLAIKKQKSPFIQIFGEIIKQGIIIPQNFQYFTLQDYEQFMMNYSAKLVTQDSFKEKFDFYNLVLLNDQSYIKNINKYKSSKKLSSSSQFIVQIINSLLINNLAPFQIKMRCLKCVRQLYLEANLIFMSKIQQILLPYFEYIVDLLCKNKQLIDKYFEKIEKKSDADVGHSRAYIIQIILIIKTWQKCNSIKTSISSSSKLKKSKIQNLRIKIDKAYLNLGVSQNSISFVNQLKKFHQNIQTSQSFIQNKYRNSQNNNQQTINKQIVESVKKRFNSISGYNGIYKQQNSLKKTQLNSKRKLSISPNTNKNQIYKITNSKDSKAQIHQNSELQFVNQSQSKSPSLLDKLKPNYYAKYQQKQRFYLDLKYIQKNNNNQNEQAIYYSSKIPHPSNNNNINLNQNYNKSQQLKKTPIHNKRLSQYSGYKLSDVIKYHESKSNNKYS